MTVKSIIIHIFSELKVIYLFIESFLSLYFTVVICCPLDAKLANVICYCYEATWYTLEMQFWNLYFKVNPLK